MNADKIFGVAAVTMVAAGLVLAFLFIGTPGYSRMLALDKQRVQDLQSMKSDLHVHYGYPGASLPAQLPSGILKRDPSTNRPYQFRRVSRTAYALCANFSAQSQPEDSSWRHGSGQKCYNLDVRQPGSDYAGG